MRGGDLIYLYPMHRIIAREMSNFQILNLIKQTFVKKKKIRTF